MLIISVIGLASMLLGLILVDSLFLLNINLFLLGLFVGSKGAIAYLYMLELAPASIRPALHMFALTTEAVLEIIGGLLIWWVQNGFYVILVIIIGNSGLMFVVFLSPESPKFLYASKRWEELHQTLDYIAKFNNAEEWKGKFDEEVHSNHHNEEQLGFIEILKNPRIRLNLLIMSINWAWWSFSFYKLYIIMI